MNRSLRITGTAPTPAAFLSATLCRVIGLWVGWAALGTEAFAQGSLTAPYTRITNAGVGSEPASSVVGAWGDYDNDGWLDLFVGNHGNSVSWLYHNNRDGTFTKAVAEPITVETFAEHWSVAWADYDNDGWLDLIVSNHDRRSAPRLYRNLGGGAFRSVTGEEAGPAVEEISRTQGLAWADYDNDGRLDLFLANGDLGLDYSDALYHNEGGGRFTSVSNDVTEPILSSSMGSWSDYDNDGDMDLFVPHTGGVGNTLFRNEGQGRFIETAGIGLDAIGESLGATWGDFDNDGDLDLFVNNVSLNGPVTPNFFFRNRGDGTFEQITTGALVSDQDHFVSSVWLDYDNDGWLDLFVTVLNGSNRLYRNEGDGTFVRVGQGRLVTDRDRFGSSAVGDYDNDGFPDLFITTGTIFGPARSALYRNDGNLNSWIKIRCVGTDSNRSAIGAKIRVRAKVFGKDLWQMRQIVGTEGWVTFNSLDAVFGLGDATVIETLRVEWPSGLVQEFRDLAVKQSLILVERTGLSGERVGSGDLEIKLSGPRQQRYRLEASTDLTEWVKVSSRTIVDPDGTETFRITPGAASGGQFFRAVPE